MIRTNLQYIISFFYHSTLYRLISEGVSDLHCMSDEYLTEELIFEYKEKTGNRRSAD